MRNILLTLGCTFAAVMAGKVGVCQKNCGLDFGKCLITTGNFETCLKSEGSCALECLKNVNGGTVMVSGSGEVCQKNCGIDYGKCLVTTFDINTCTKDQAACALDCLKGTQLVQPRYTKVEVADN